MVTFLEPEVARQIKVIAAQTDRTVQDIGEEAILEWLKQHPSKLGVTQLHAPDAPFLNKSRAGKKTG